MADLTYIFVGDKFTILNRMVAHGCKVAAAYCAADFYSREKLSDSSIPVETISGKQMLLDAIQRSSFDVLVSNGCPYILPVSSLKRDGQQFVNVHASLLPRFQGPHPVTGALQAGEDLGASVHHMIDEVDQGEIISQYKVPYTPDLDAGLGYFLTFEAEIKAFDAAIAREFKVDSKLNESDVSPNYFRRDEKTMQLNFGNSAEEIVRHVRSLNLYAQGAWFAHDGHRFKVMDADVITHPSMQEKNDIFQVGEVAYIYDATIIVRVVDGWVRLQQILTDSGSLQVGSVLK